ncbi:sialate O-acetylesterase [Flavobacterium sp.]|uniref:sialate O-acetylesterase n=1 Tax=Flavobacterium sp. TaxID=239 RepID=UPI0025C1777C|nr:sialate O-acetylesterase [Flavobacterium sp.]
MINQRLFNSICRTFVVLAAACSASAQKGDTFKVFYLGGQSNMEGFGFNKDLPADLSQPMKDVYIFDGNRGGDGEPGLGVGKWEQLRPGHGTGFASDGKENKPSDRFGVELTFAKRMRELYPNDKIAIIKYARNGSGLDSLATGPFGCWEPEYKAKPNQYDFFLKTIEGAKGAKDVNGDGKADTLVFSGILWMQGEGDGSFTEEIAMEYYKNLNHLIEMMRSVFKEKDLPVVVGKISDSGNSESGIVFKNGDLVRYCQEKFVRDDKRAGIVRSTSRYSYSDPYHYDSAGYIDFGKNFADEMAKLLKK